MERSIGECRAFCESCCHRPRLRPSHKRILKRINTNPRPPFSRLEITPPATLAAPEKTVESAHTNVSPRVRCSLYRLAIIPFAVREIARSRDVHLQRQSVLTVADVVYCSIVYRLQRSAFNGGICLHFQPGRGRNSLNNSRAGICRSVFGGMSLYAKSLATTCLLCLQNTVLCRMWRQTRTRPWLL
ncbi:hypothetical protein LMG29542_08034 [Paraburkholderia humisilvae]|uniref:Uncharacterized protein n=1 Tax=Paraburkholderia humisilvae TaxID=627669 RepID=A0A6J5FBM3_9BURK|nr:hypothetical protein LMG29542_08034 [Paraburkholderia humisilvae]